MVTDKDCQILNILPSEASINGKNRDEENRKIFITTQAYILDGYFGDAYKAGFFY